jgi:hypothetical protein
MEPWGSKGELDDEMWAQTKALLGDTDAAGNLKRSSEYQLGGDAAALSDQNFASWAEDYISDPQAYRSSDEFYQNVRGLRDDMQRYEGLSMGDLLGEIDMANPDPIQQGNLYSWMNFMDEDDSQHINKLANLVSLYSATPDSDLWMRKQLKDFHVNLYTSALAGGWTPQQYLRTFVKDRPGEQSTASMLGPQ